MYKKFFAILVSVLALFIFSSVSLAQNTASHSKRTRVASRKVVEAAPKRKNSAFWKKLERVPKPMLKKSARRFTVRHKATVAKKGFFRQMVLNPVVMMVWIPLLLLLIPVSIQVYRRFPWREEEEIPAVCQEEAIENDSSWDQRAWERIKDFARRFRKKPALEQC